MTQLSEHFTLEEAVFSSTAMRLGIANNPDDATLAIMQTAAVQLEKVRELLGFPMHVDSWYRSEPLNTAVGGAGHSAHETGWAIDFICPDFGTPAKIAEAILGAGLVFDQIIMEGAWVHISFDPKARTMALTATFVNGKASYANGIA